LREAFHDPLLVQVGRKMALTPRAEGLLEHVRDFLLHAEAILHSSPVFDPLSSNRRFRLMMSDYVETVVMTQVLPQIQKLAPRVEFELLSKAGDAPEALDRGEIDLAITPTKYLVPKHPSERLFDDDFICLAWSENTQVHNR